MYMYLAFFVILWNLHKEKLHSLGSSSDLVPHNSFNRCMVNGRNAMIAHEIYSTCIYIHAYMYMYTVLIYINAIKIEFFLISMLEKKKF